MTVNKTRITIAKPTRKLQVGEGDKLIARVIETFEEGNHRGGPLGALMQFHEAESARSWLRSAQFGRLCSELKLPSHSQVRTTCHVGERLEMAKRRLEYADAFALLYVVTTLDSTGFESFVERGRSAETMGAGELREGIVGELIKGRPPFR